MEFGNSVFLRLKVCNVYTLLVILVLKIASSFVEFLLMVDLGGQTTNINQFQIIKCTSVPYQKQQSSKEKYRLSLLARNSSCPKLFNRIPIEVKKLHALSYERTVFFAIF